MSNNKKLIPKRRFNRFEKDKQWFIEKLSSFAEFSKGNGYSKNDLCEQGLPILLYGRLYTQYETIIRSVDTFIINKKDSTVFSSGDEVVVPASGETAKDIARASFIHKSGIIIGGDLNIIKPKDKVISHFLAISLSSGDQKKELIKRAQGKTVVHLHNSDLKDIKFIFPTKNEQTQIGEFFKKLDTLIQTQQKKLEKTKTLKSAYLAEMFPCDSELKPKIRFKEFRENWQLLTLGELKDVRDGTHDSPTYHKQGFPLVTSKNLTDSGLDINEVSLISKTDFEKINKRSKVDRGDILFGMIGTIGNPVLVERDDFAIKNVALIKKGGNILNIFLIQLLKSQIFEKYVNSKNVGNTQKFLALSQIREFNLVTPFIKEQTKIGNFFKLLDKKIALEQRKLEKLNNIKQAYLNEMFV